MSKQQPPSSFREHLHNVRAGASAHVAEAGKHARTAGEAISSGYKAVGGAHGAYKSTRNYVRETFGEAGTAGQRAKQAQEYATSDEGRANARNSAALSFHRFLSDRSKKAFRKGGTGYVTGAVFQFAHAAFAAHVQKQGHDLKTFQDVAKVRRGDPEIKNMTHDQLRRVAEHAKTYGGHDHEDIFKKARGELEHRESVRIANKENAAIKSRELRSAHMESLKAGRHEGNMQRKQEAHKLRMKQLREVSGHVHEAEMARQTIKNTAAAQRHEMRITKKTKSGGYDDKKQWHSNEEIKASQKAKSKSSSRGSRMRSPRMR